MSPIIRHGTLGSHRRRGEGEGWKEWSEEGKVREAGERQGVALMVKYSSRWYLNFFLTVELYNRHPLICCLSNAYKLNQSLFRDWVEKFFKWCPIKLALNKKLIALASLKWERKEFSTNLKRFINLTKVFSDFNSVEYITFIAFFFSKLQFYLIKGSAFL